MIRSLIVAALMVLVAAQSQLLQAQSSGSRGGLVEGNIKKDLPFPLLDRELV